MRSACAACSVWVPASRRQTRALEQQLVPLTEGSRTCPRCHARMDAFELNHILIDRCFSHGFWFDRDELAKVLQGDTSPEAFADAYRARQLLADGFEYRRGTLLEALYLWLRSKRRRP